MDQFILFDTPQFIRHGWIERNRILKVGGGYVYIAVPLIKHGQKTAINDIRINNAIDWKSKILGQLVHYKRAPYYDTVIELVQKVFKNDYTDIVSLNKSALEMVCDYLDIATPIEVFSDMELEIEPAQAPDEWALNICKAIPGADEYWNPPGGKSFFYIEKYESAGVKIKFQKVKITEYKQGKNDFEGGLSIIDLMMYNTPQNVNQMMDEFEFI